MSRAEVIQMSPALIERFKSATMKMLSTLDAEGFTNTEKMVVLAMTLRHYEEETGLQLSGLVGIAKGAES